MIEWMKPSLSEVIVFIIIYVIIVIMIQLFQATSIKHKIKIKSRCYQLKNSIKAPTYVKVKNTEGTSLYDIKYDIDHKTMSLDCACPTGPTVNNFNNIKLYNFATHASEYGNLTCNCDSQYGNIDNAVRSEEYLLNNLKYQHIKYLKEIIYQITSMTEQENKQFIDFLNSITVSFKPGFFNTKKYIDNFITEQGIALNLTDTSKNNIKNILDIIIKNVISGDLDISLKSSIKNNIIKNNPNLTQNEINILLIIVDKIDNNIINKGNNVIEYTIHMNIPDNPNNILNKTLLINPNYEKYKNLKLNQIIKKIYSDMDEFVEMKDISNTRTDILLNYEGIILQSENSKDFFYEGNPDIIRYMDSDDMNIFERNIVSDV